MAGIMNKFRDIFLGPEEYDDDYYEDFDEDSEPHRVEESPRVSRSTSARHTSGVTATSPSSSSISSSSSTKVVNIHTNVQMQVVISYPKAVDDASHICDYLKDSKTVVVNLEEIDRDECQRIVDFLSGVSYALNGEIQSISTRIFIVAPANVDITGQFKEELKSNSVLFPFVSSVK